MEQWGGLNVLAPQHFVYTLPPAALHNPAEPPDSGGDSESHSLRFQCVPM